MTASLAPADASPVESALNFHLHQQGTNVTLTRVVVNDGNLAGPTYAVADGLLDVLEGQPVEPVGAGWRVLTGLYLLTSALGLMAGFLGMRRARSWARHRHRGQGWVSGLRLGWLLQPAAILMSLPALAKALTMGTRTVTWEQVRKMLSGVQSYSRIPLILTCDEEGGRVNRLMDTIGTTRIGPMLDYKDQGPEKARENARTIAADQRELGFNLDLAPVADVWSTPANTVIGDRAYSDDFGGTDEDAWYFNAGGSWELPHEFGLSAGVGYNMTDDALGDDYLDWNIGVSRSWGLFTAGLSYVGTDGSGTDLFGDLADDRVVLTLTVGN